MQKSQQMFGTTFSSQFLKQNLNKSQRNPSEKYVAAAIRMATHFSSSSNNVLSTEFIYISAKPEMEEHSELKDLPSKSRMAKQGGRNNQHAQPFNLHTEQRGNKKEREFIKRAKERVIEEARRRIPAAQGLPFTTDKPQNLAKPAVKEQTKPRNIWLHTEQRAAQRAGYNHLVASKINSLQILKRFEEKLLEHIEEEEIKSMRRKMVPKAQLMPIFDKPFFPQRSTRPLTVPREPCFHLVKPSYNIMSDQPYKLHKYLSQTMKSI